MIKNIYSIFIIYGEILGHLSESLGEYRRVYNLLGMWKAEMLGLRDTEEVGLLEDRKGWACERSKKLGL